LPFMCYIFGLDIRKSVNIKQSTQRGNEMVNKCIFIGRLGSDPDTRSTQNGKTVTNLNLAVTEKWKDNEHTEWVRCIAWGKLAEICGQYLFKGSLVYVSGRLQTKKWDDKDGVTRYSTEIILHEMKMLSSKQENRPREQSSGDSFDRQPMGDDILF